MTKYFIQKNILKVREDIGSVPSNNFLDLDKVVSRTITISELKEDVETLKDDVSSLQASVAPVVMYFQISDLIVDIAIGDKVRIIMPEALDGREVTQVKLFINGSGGANISGQYDISITNITTTDVIGTGTLARNLANIFTNATLNGANTLVSENDVIEINVDAIPTGGVFGSTGLAAAITFE
jgi:hypothetical protein